jgi:hypothetical protein
VDSGTAGMAMTDAGSDPPTDAEVCDAACAAVNDQYSLPGAFCEDWRFPSHELTPAFCGPVDASGCDGLCEARLSLVSEACHDALRDAVSCAARSGEYSSLQVPATCFLEACYPVLFRVSSECYGLREDLEAQRAIWDSAAGGANYTFVYSGVATVSVVGSVATVTEGEPIGDPPTMSDLFDRIELELDAARPPFVDDDESLGFPASFRATQPECQATATGERFTVTNVVIDRVGFE